MSSAFSLGNGGRGDPNTERIVKDAGRPEAIVTIYPRLVPTVIPRPPAHLFCKSPPILPSRFFSRLHCHLLHCLFLLQDSLITELIPFTVLKQKEKQNTAHIKGFRIHAVFTTDLGVMGRGLLLSFSPFFLLLQLHTENFFLSPSLSREVQGPTFQPKLSSRYNS